MQYITLKSICHTHIKLIKFLNIKLDTPFSLIDKYYKEAVSLGQKSPEIFVISSYDTSLGEVDSRCVNLKFIDGNSFIFFTNYTSPKSVQFQNHPKISTLIFWDKINLQIRMKGIIKKTEREFNRKYFAKRSKAKNALAISSNQSSRINSYQEVLNKYETAFKSKDLSLCPKYWGGFSFDPYSIEFWKAGENRLNKRDLYELNNNKWVRYLLEP